MFSSNELDGIDHAEKFARVFRVTVDIVNPSEPIMGESDLFSKHLDNTLNKPLALYKNHNEFQQKINDFRKWIVFLVEIIHLNFFSSRKAI